MTNYGCFCVFALCAAGCIAGPKGDRGDTGAGASTVNGGAVSSGDKLVSTLYCDAKLEGSAGVYVAYGVDQFESGNIFVNASVRDNADQASNSTFFAPTQNGYATGAITVEKDEIGAANAGFFSISVDRTTKIISVVYKDSDAVGGQLTYTEAASNCVTNTY